MKAEITYRLVNKINRLQAEMRKGKGLQTKERPNQKLDESLYQLIAAGKEFEVRDEKLDGLVLRVLPTGRMVYTLVYARGKRVTLGPTNILDHDQAREKARKVLAELCLTGEDPIEKRKSVRADNYLQFLSKTYVPWLKQNVVHWEATRDMLTKAFPELHSLPLNAITPGVVESWRVRRLEEGMKPTTVNRQLDDLRACLNRARKIWRLLAANPLDDVEPCKTDKTAKVRFLSKDEEARLREALEKREETIRAERDSANGWREDRGYPLHSDLRRQAFVDHLKPAVLVSLATGLRRGELLKLQWENIDFEQRNLTVVGETAKSGKTRHIPLNDEALATLKLWGQQMDDEARAKLNQWRKQKRDEVITKLNPLEKPSGVKPPYLFTGPDGKPFQDMRSSWEGVLEKAKIKNFRWHDLRHTFASKLVMRGVDLNTVRELLGHSDYKMTLRYAHLAPEHKLEAVQKLITAQ
jgi:integrase